MKIRVGYELIYDFPQSTPLIMVLGTHFTRASDVIEPDYLTTSPSVPIFPYRDIYGNWCSRIVIAVAAENESGDVFDRNLEFLGIAPNPKRPPCRRFCSPERALKLNRKRRRSTYRASSAWQAVDVRFGVAEGLLWVSCQAMDLRRAIEDPKSALDDLSPHEC
jgi:hypothetical protein